MLKSIVRIIVALVLVGMCFVGGLVYLASGKTKASAHGVPQASAAPAVNAPKGKLTIGRVYTEYDYMNAVVTYENDTATTFASQVNIQCDALDGTGTAVATNSRSFFAHERGPIAPGFKGTIKVPMNLAGAKAKSASCVIAIAQ